MIYAILNENNIIENVVEAMYPMDSNWQPLMPGSSAGIGDYYNGHAFVDTNNNYKGDIETQRIMQRLNALITGIDMAQEAKFYNINNNQDLNLFRSIGVLLGKQAQALISKDTVSTNELIDMAPFMKVWEEGSYQINDIVYYKHLPYKCVQAHNSTGNPTWNPKETPALWTVLHATDAIHAIQYQAPTGAQDAYMKGEYIEWYGTIKKCIQDNTVWDPNVYPEAWEDVEIPGNAWNYTLGGR